MIKTAIITGFDEGFPVWHPYDGFAKNKSVAKWIFEYCGWNAIDSLSPELAVMEYVIEWMEADSLYPGDPKRLYVLGACLLMN